MNNTILTTLMLLLTALPASAQFYTITKETPVSDKTEIKATQTAETSQDTTMDDVLLLSDSIAAEKEENLGQNILNAQKSDDNKSRPDKVVSIDKDGGTTHSTINLSDGSLPELTIPNLLAEIKKNGIKYPKIVLAQAILETGWFKSSVCRNKHNLFGLTNPRTGQYYEFDHWTDSVKAYYDKIQKRYKGGNYLLWLDKIGYAEEKTYVRALIKLLKQL